MFKCSLMRSDYKKMPQRIIIASERGSAYKQCLHQERALTLNGFYVWECVNVIFYFLWTGTNRRRVRSRWPDATDEGIIYLCLAIVAESHIYECSGGKSYIYIETRKPALIGMTLLSTYPPVIVAYRAEKMFLFLPNALFMGERPRFTTERSILGKVKGNRINLEPINKFLEGI